MYSLKNEEELKLYKCLAGKNHINIVIRGNYFHSNTQYYYLRSAYRYRYTSTTQYHTLSFRCVKKVK